MCLCELLEERLGRVEFEGECGLADSHGGGLLAHLLTLQVALQGIEKEPVVGHAVPVEDLLLLLCANAVVLVQEIKESALGLLQRCIGTRLQVAQIGEDALFELLGVLDGTAKGLESEGEASHDVGAGDVEEVVPAWVLERVLGACGGMSSALTIEHKRRIRLLAGGSGECTDPAASRRGPR